MANLECKGNMRLYTPQLSAEPLILQNILLLLFHLSDRGT